MYETSGNMPEDESIVITVDTENGRLGCNVVATFEVDGREERKYIALMPQTAEADEIQLFAFLETDDGIDLIAIEDEDEFEQALNVFNELLAEE